MNGVIAMRQITRRSTLASLGGIIGGIPASAAASGQLSKELEELREIASQKYGKQEARVGTRIVEEEIKNKRKENLSEQETYRRISNRIKHRTETSQWGAAVERVDSRRTELLDNRLSGGSDIGTQNDQDCNCTGSDRTYIDIDDSEQDLDDSGGAAVKASTSVTYDRERTFVETGLYGSGYALTRLFGSVNISTDSDYDVTSEYYRNFEVAGAQCVVSLFVRPSYGGVNAKAVETAEASREGTVKYTKTFSLNGGTTYDIGAELISEGSSSSTEGNIADAYTSSEGRKLTVEELSIVEH